MFIFYQSASTKSSTALETVIKVYSGFVMIFFAGKQKQESSALQTNFDPTFKQSFSESSHL